MSYQQIWLKQYDYHKRMCEQLHERLAHDVINTAKRLWDERRDQRIELKKVGVRDFPDYGDYKECSRYDWELDGDKISVTASYDDWERDSSINFPFCLIADESQIATYIDCIVAETECMVNAAKKARIETLDEKIEKAKANLDRLLKEKEDGNSL